MSFPRPRLFELTQSAKSILKLDTFKGDVSTTDFVEQICTEPIAGLKRDAGKIVMDPKPFIRTFEGVLQELKKLREQAQHKCSELENSATQAELAYKQGIERLQGEFRSIDGSFHALENRTGEVGKTAIRIGEQLETIDKQRSRVTESRDIIEGFMEFQEGSSDWPDILKSGEELENKIKAAVIARRLSAVAKDVESDERARIAIEKFCEGFETEMLNSFNTAYRAGDERDMASCAKVLFEFNGGTSCIQSYVNQHEFFISNEMIEEMDQLDGTDNHADLSNPTVAPPLVDTSLVKLYDNIRIIVRKEAEIISAVFPQPAMVMQVFLQRVFAQSVQSRIELLLLRAERVSRLAYLRTLASTHAETRRLVENLKLYCDKEGSLKESSDVSDLVATASPEETLDRCMADLFVPYTEGDRYLTKELASLVELFGGIVGEFLSYMQQRKKTSMSNKSVLTRTLNQISSTTSATMLSSPSMSDSSSTSPNLSTNPFEQGIQSHVTLLEKVDDSGFCLLSNDAILRLLKIHAEAVMRCVELTDSQDIPSAIQSLYDRLVDFIGSKYLDIVLDDVLDNLDNGSEPETICFPLTRAATDIIQLMQQHFQSTVIPLVARTPSVHREVLTSKNDFMAVLEVKVNTMLEKSIEGIVQWLHTMLSRQKRDDFRLRDEEVMMMSMGTSPCVQCVDFITRVYRAASKALKGKNLEAFLLKTGGEFHSMLLEHFKKFYVTPIGGILVTKDIAKYQEVIQMFKIPALNERFEMLRQLGNIFVVKPDILRSILSEGYLARLDPNVLYPYLEKRVDFKSANLSQVLGITMDENGAACKGAMPSATTSTNSKGAQRRSLFMNDKTLKDMMKRHVNNNDFLSTFH